MKNLWPWKNVKMSSCCTCTIVSKVSTNCQPGVRFVIISRWKNMRFIFPVFVCICVCICNFLDGGTRSKKKYFMKFYEFVNFMNFMKFFEKWGRGGTKIWSLDNWQSLRPITLWGSVKKSELINYKGWQWVQRDLVQTTFSSEWRGGTVPETWPVSVVLWPGSAPSHKLCEQGHSLDGTNWVTF